jgi:hypothetical protein
MVVARKIAGSEAVITTMAVTGYVAARITIEKIIDVTAVKVSLPP